MEKVALIPLRGGSKSIPKKNIRPMAGKPLCYWSLSSAFRSELFDRIIVSTDSDEIADVIKGFEYDIEVIKRPAHLATDKATTESVMLHIAESVDFDLLFTIQATSPMVTPDDLIFAYKMFIDRGFDSLLTGVRVKRFFWSFDGRPLNYDPSRRPMRQDFSGVLMENGAFYITKRHILVNQQCRLGGKIGIYEMDESKSIDIDEPSDWELAEKLLNKRISEDVR